MSAPDPLEETADGTSGQPQPGIDLAVRHGERVCFLGPSGCGKTALPRIGNLTQGSRVRITIDAARLCVFA